MTNQASYDNLDDNLRSFFNNLLQKSLETQITIYFNKMPLENNNNNIKNLKKKNLAVQPNHGKTFLSSFAYNFWNKHVEHFDQQMGAVHSVLGNKDVKIMKIGTIILIGFMIIVLKYY